MNGKTTQLDHSSTLQALIDHFCQNPKHVIAEINEKIVKRNAWSDHPLKNGDRIELVTLVGGG